MLKERRKDVVVGFFVDVCYFSQSFRPAVWCIIAAAQCFMMLKETKLMRKSTQTGTKKNG